MTIKYGNMITDRALAFGGCFLIFIERKMAMAGITYNSSYDEILKNIKESGATALNKSLADNDATHNLQKQTVTDNFNAQLRDTESTYSDEYRENAVQKLINERQVAENMANLGLTDSGLNRTQQTAVQLSYANNKAKIDRQKQSLVDSLKLQLNNSLNEIETSRISNASAINQSYESAWADSAQKVYNDNLDYMEEIRKEQIAAAKEAAEKEASKQIYTYSGEDIEKGLNIYRGSDGKTYYSEKGLNPYTGDNNTLYMKEDKNGKFVSSNLSKGTDAQKAAAKYGVCTNGYQPKGVFIDGKDYGKIQNSNQSIPAEKSMTGKKQNVWMTTGRRGVHYWFWDGTDNNYFEIKPAGVDENGDTIWTVA